MSLPSLSESKQSEQLNRQLQWAELKITVLEERLRLELVAKYGAASEKLSDAQLEKALGRVGREYVECRE